MSIYTFLIVAMLVAMAFNKDRFFMLTLILYLLIMFFEAMADSNQRLEIKILLTVVFVMFCMLGLKFVREEGKH